MTAVCLLAVVSCEEHTEIYDNRVSVGNILLSDNTLISPYGYDKDCHLAVGVVFYTNKDTALVVGLRELGEYQYTDSLGTVSSVTNDDYSKRGVENTAAIMADEEMYLQSRRSCSIHHLCPAGLCRRLASFVPWQRTCLSCVTRWGLSVEMPFQTDSI